MGTAFPVRPLPDTSGANETGSLENQLLEPIPHVLLGLMKKWTRQHFAFPAGGRRRLEYLEIACARRLANVAQFGLARPLKRRSSKSTKGSLQTVDRARATLSW